MPETPIKNETPAAPRGWPVGLRLPAQWALTDDRLLELAGLNDAWRFERSADGALEISPVVGPRSSGRRVRIGAQLVSWCDANGSGAAFAGAGFSLPDGSIRAAAAAWISAERLAAIDATDEGYWPVCPDFVVEIRSPSDRLPQQQAKMRQWMANGARLGWLLDPLSDTIWVYRERQADPEQLERPNELDCGDILPNLTINLSQIWR